MFTEWLFPLFNLLHLLHSLSGSSSDQVPTKAVSYLRKFVLKISLFDSRVDIRMGVIFPSLLRHG